MMISGGNIQEYSEIKKLSIRDYLNKFNNFVEGVLRDMKKHS